MATVPRRVILVLIPDPVVSNSLIPTLQPYYTVYQTKTTAEAVQQIMLHHPALIMLEWDLPEGAGLAFIKRLRVEPMFGSTAIMCVSHEKSVRAKANAFQAGADDYIVSPIHQEGILARIAVLLRQRNRP